MEDIVLESPEQATHFLTPPRGDDKRVEFEYTLTPRFSKVEYHYRLFNNCFLEIEKCEKPSRKLAKTAFHVGLLEARPKKEKKTAWMTFIAALLTGTASVVMGFFLKDIWLAAGTAVLSLLLFLAYYFSYREMSIFNSRSGKAPLITLTHRCQCKKGLKDFVVRLESKIAQNTLPASSSYFAEETRWHRALNEQGWISDDEYRKARNRIMKQFNRRTS